MREVEKYMESLLMAPGPNGKMGIPFFLWGPPGVGKTATVERMARDLGWPCETLIVVLRDPTEMGGLTIVGEDGETRLSPPQWARELKSAVEERAKSAGRSAGGALIFLDEFNCSSPTQQASALRIQLDRVVGELELPPAVRIVGAGNPPADNSAAQNLIAPAANRIVHVDYPTPTVDEWTEYTLALPDGSDDEDWTREWRLARVQIGSWLRRRPDCILSLPAEEEERGTAWASPRSWELACRGLASTRVAGLPDTWQKRAIAGAVGEGMSNEAWQYFSDLDLPDPEDVLAGRATIPYDRTDRVWAAFSAVCTAAISDAFAKKERADRIASACEVGAAVVGQGFADIVGGCLRPVCKQGVIHAAMSLRTTRKRVLEALRSVPHLLEVAQMTEEARGK